MTIIRDATAQDKVAWLRLWSGYLVFYETSLMSDVTEHTWQRALDPASPILARLAESDGAITGFAMAVLHEGTWVRAPICYLEDLFVDPVARGAGVGRALIEDLVQLGQRYGWSRLYWHSRAGNPARILYDRFAIADDAVHYQLALPHPSTGVI